MLKRYKKDSKGRLKKTASVYTQKEHNIDLNLVDHDAVKIVQKLSRSGYETYIVGGAVRDLLLGRKPKDFDLVSAAEPNQIRKIFRNSRIIGKRFRLVHVYYPDDKIIELSTFRSLSAGTFNNVYGTIEEDAQRRDFSINALYYDPVKQILVDFVGGFADIQAKKLRPVISLGEIFIEDPVRIIRALKYAQISKCSMNLFLKNRIKKDAKLLAQVSPSRMGEELFKFLKSGLASPLFRDFIKYKVMVHFMPAIKVALETETLAEKIAGDLAVLDKAINDHQEARKGLHLAHLVGRSIYELYFKGQTRPGFIEVYQGLKDFIKPLTPANIDVEDAVAYLFKVRPYFVKNNAFPALTKTPSHHKPDKSEFEKDIAIINEKRLQKRRRPIRPKKVEPQK